MTRFHLKSLELIGFKSFVEPTKLLFKPGINAIVGPNGCGKSNIADAIRWVLGEQSPRCLRGKKMEDLIFAGSQKKKGLGMTQVSLTLAQMDEIDYDPAGSKNGGEEIIFTRRLFRTGESEYLINKTPCRLKDINDSLLDLKMGTNGLSLISQEQVIEFITSKPEQRRYLIEEAAGVVKYKVRKKEALEKLEHARQNLLRIKDIFLEVQKQKNYLGRQANKALEYKKIKQEIRDKELILLFHELGELQEEWYKKDKAYQELKEEFVRLETQKSAYEEQRKSYYTSIVEEEKGQQKAKDFLYGIEADINHTTQRIELLKEKIADFNGTEQKLQEEHEELRQKANVLEKELYFASNQQRNYNTSLNQEKVFLEKEEKQFSILNNKYTHTRDRLESEKAELITLLSETSELKNRLTTFDTRIESLTKREAKLNKERDLWQGKVEEIKPQLEQVNKIKYELQEALENLQGRKTSLKEDLDLTQTRLESKRKEKESLKGELSRQLARLESLETLQNSQERGEEGPRSLIKSGHSGLRCLVVDILGTHPEWERAIEAVLGEKLLAIIARDHESILESVRHIKSNNGSRNIFIPLQPRVSVREKGRCPKQEFSKEQLIGPALDKVEYDPEYASVIKYLLGDVILVRNLEEALALWKQGVTERTLVTLDGEVLDPKGGIAGGDNLSQDQGILGRKRNIQGLRKISQSLARKIDNACKDEEELRKRVLSIQVELEGIDDKFQINQKTFFDCQGKLRALEETGQKERQFLEALSYEAQEIEIEREGLLLEQTNLQQQLETKQQFQQEKEVIIQAIKEESILYGTQLEEIQNQLIKSKVKVSAIREKREAARNCLHRIKGDYEDISARIRRQKADQIRIQGEKTEAKRSLDQAKENLQMLLIKRDNVQKKITDKEEDLRVKREELKNIEEAEKTCKDHLIPLTPKIQETSLACSELKWQTNQIKNKLVKDYNVPEEEVMGQTQGSLWEIDEEEEQNKLIRLTEQLNKLGEINVTAIEDYELIQERYKFLQEQQEDLHKSIGSLHQAINKINRSIEKDFFNTFNALNKQLDQTFKKLFQGGEAKLILIQENDLIESGVDIIVQPPGKKLQNISLLSAGEKTLSALALLLSVFMLKPTPFCLMDEVDAPLDEANLERFSHLLKELSVHTQFIMITHNKGTMAWANALYGITMEVDGVSKIISVSLKDTQRAA